jgi:cbb3-type cytochrome c oxidase subunit III
MSALMQRVNITRCTGLAVALVMATAISGGWSLLSAQDPLPEGVTAEMIAAGGEVFAGTAGCKACHGEGAKGVENMTGDLTDVEWRFAEGGTLEAVVKAIKEGVSSEKTGGLAMPAFGDKLTDEQVKAAAAYILSLGPKPAAAKAE